MNKSKITQEKQAVDYTMPVSGSFYAIVSEKTNKIPVIWGSIVPIYWYKYKAVEALKRLDKPGLIVKKVF